MLTTATAPDKNVNVGYINSVDLTLTDTSFLEDENPQLKELKKAKEKQNVANEKLQSAAKNVAKNPDAMLAAIDDTETANELFIYAAQNALDGLPEAKDSTLLYEQHKEEIDAVLSSSSSGNDPVKRPPTDREIVDGLLEHLRKMNENYVRPHGNALAMYIQFMKDISAVVALLGKHVKEAPDNKTHVDQDGEVLKLLAEIQNKYHLINNRENTFSDPKNALYKSTGDAAGKEAAERWATEFGLDPSQVRAQYDASGKVVSYYVTIDVVAVQNLYSLVEKAAHEPLNQASYAAFQTGFDTTKETLNNASTRLSQKYADANGKLNSTSQLYASLIAALYQMIMDALKF